MERIIPKGARVLVKMPEREERSSGGLWIPATAHEDQPVSGFVVAVGEDCEEAWPKDQQVVFGRHAGAKIQLGERGERSFLMIREADIMGIIVEYNGDSNAE